MNLKLLPLLLFSLSLGAGVFAQSPLPGSEETLTLLSPEFLSGGTSTASTTAVQGDVLNPAASGGNQRTTFDMNYTALISQGVEGFGLNAGLSIPTRYGVFTGSLQGLFSGMKDFNTGNGGQLNLSYAKDVYRNLYLGVGLGTGINIYSGKPLDWSLAMDFGMMHFLGDVGPLKEFRYGVALRDAGKAPESYDGTQPLPSVLTLGTSADFRLVKDDTLDWGFHTDLSFPTFQNARITLGSDITLWKVLGINAGWQMDVKRALAGSGRSFVPTLGISFNFVTDLGENAQLIGLDQKYSKNEMKVTTAGSMLSDGVYAAGLGIHLPLGVVDRNPPAITVDYPVSQYISPNNDGKKDALILPMGITDERYIKTFVLEISNVDGTIVRTIRNKDDRPENEGLANFMDKLLEVKSGIAIPESLRWDGTTDSGALAGDGKYTLVLKATDDNLNVGVSASYDVFIDATAPEVVIDSVAAPDLIFSPDGDGNKDEIILGLQGSLEDKWEATILNSFGAPVRTFNQENTTPGKVTWDGKDDLGQNVPDGVYAFQVATTDRADNTVSSRMENLLVNTQVTPVVITLNYRDFSPNNDGVTDILEMIPTIPVKDGIRSWSLEILDRAGKVVRTYADNSGRMPSALLNWDGKIDSGTVAQEGTYTAKLSLDYIKGNRPISISPDFVLDTTAPKASVVVEGLPSFSPDSDGQRDELPLLQEASTEDLWRGEILDSQNNVMKSWTWRGAPIKNLPWDGLNNQGLLQNSGDYSYSLKSTDRAGNSFEIRTRPFKLDTVAREALISTEGLAFSPNGDGKKDLIGLFPSTNEPKGLTSYTVVVKDKESKTVKTFQGGNTLQAKLNWDGLSDAGVKVPEGTYRASLSLKYDSGKTANAQSQLFTLDTTFPSVEVSSNFSIFSPNGDSKKDVLMLKQKSSVESSWTAQITDSKNKILKSFNWTGAVTDVPWDGKDEAGNLVADGLYKYDISSEDAAGNKTLVSLPGIQVDNRQANLFLTLDKTAFSPAFNGDKGNIRFNLVPTLKEGIDTWTLKMVHKSKGLIKEFSGTETVPPQLIWDGKLNNVPVEGIYQAELTVLYLKGDEPKVQSTNFIVDSSVPEVTLNLSPDLFSPDNDGFADELTIAIKVQDLVGVESWSLKIKEPEGALFTEFGGKESPAETILWDGRSRSGELVQAAVDYPYTLTVNDKLGQSKEIKGLIPIDILVIKDGEKYKIAVPSIVFAPNAPSILSDNTEPAIKNQQILKRLAVVLNRFSSYKVQVEGHANVTRFQSAESIQEEDTKFLRPLSLGRANAVKDQLVKFGVSASRLSVEGMGGSRPVAAFTDRDNIWKNRRVEFILLR